MPAFWGPEYDHGPAGFRGVFVCVSGLVLYVSDFSVAGVDGFDHLFVNVFVVVFGDKEWFVSVSFEKFGELYVAHAAEDGGAGYFVSVDV